jgi:hypothetical protein
MKKDEFIEKWTVMYQGENGEDEETHERIKQLMLSDLEALSQHEVIKNEVAVCSCMQCNRTITDLSKASHGWLCDEC